MLTGRLAPAVEGRAARRPLHGAFETTVRRALLEGCTRICLHHALDGEDAVTAARRADKSAGQHLHPAYYAVGCDQRLSDDVRAALGAARAHKRAAAH